MKIVLLAMLLWGSASGLAHAAPATVDSAAAAECKALASTDFSGIPDAPSQVTDAKLVEPSETAPGYCQVKGYVAPQVGFELRLPVARWNKKFIEIGCGGHCGDTSWTFWCPLQRGYACIVSDDGHMGIGGDSLWGYNNLQAKLDWGYRAPHVVAVAGKVLTEHFYHEAAKRSYFWGCSTGGRQALQEAQRFPWDFDGIIAGAPPVNLSTLYMTIAWGILATHDSQGKPLLGKAELKLVSDAAVAKCDLDDGARDGIIGDPRHCQFDPAELACKAAQTNSCLKPAQVEAVKKVYAGPMTSAGIKLSPGGPMPGSEYGHWNEETGGNWSVAYVGVDGKPSAYEPLVTAGLRYLFFSPEQGPAWTLRDFDFDRDYQRLSVMESLYDSSNPDLRKFKAAGGKLLSYQGTNDISVMPQITEDYYETVEQTMGGRNATQGFFRLFVLPGVEHCAGGDGADTVDYLSALEAWVENGKAPDQLLAAHMKKDHSLTQPPRFPLDWSQVQFTRPVYPYPTRAQYRGRGDINDAASFGPAKQ